MNNERMLNLFIAALFISISVYFVIFHSHKKEEENLYICPHSRKGFLTIKSVGGLGDVMTQYAMLMTMANKTGKEATIDANVS